MSTDKQTLAAATPPQGPVLAPDQAHVIVQDWLNIQCGMINGVARALVVKAGDGESARQSLVRWPADLDATDDLAEFALLAMQDRQCRIERIAGEPSRDRIAFPISLPAETSLVLTLEISGRPQIQQQAVVNLLRWGAQWLKFALQRQAPVSADRLLPVFQMIVACVDQDSFKAMATRLVAELASRYRCKRVSLGVRKGRHVALQALSHSAQFKQQSNIIRTIATAMDEAIDQDCTLRLPLAGAQTPRITRAHAELSRCADNAAVCTIPLNAHGEVIGALTMERDAGEPFDQASEQQVEQLLAVLAAPLRIKYQDEKSLPAKAVSSIRAFGARLFGPEHLKLKF
ncbi:MAG: GAF domain-containing protein, partial [Pseudomonadales bacterium]